MRSYTAGATLALSVESTAMKVALVALAFSLVAACDGDGAGSITGDPSTLTCAQIRDALQAKTTEVSRQCQSPDDCAIVGNAQRSDGFPTCDCAPAFGSNCSGVGVNRAAWSSDVRAQGLLHEWDSRCVPGGCSAADICVCDCGLGNLTCDDGSCRVSMYDCFDQGGADAAVD